MPFLSSKLGRAKLPRADRSVNMHTVSARAETGSGAANPLAPALSRATVMRVADWEDVRRMALALPETSERSSRELASWRVRDKAFVWERPLRRADLRALGDHAPTGAILGARVEHLVAKEALLADDPEVFFTTPHFDGYPAVLVRLDAITVEDLEEVIVEAWLARAPKRLVKDYVDRHFGKRRPD
jgi:hypothetical protein